MCFPFKFCVRKNDSKAEVSRVVWGCFRAQCFASKYCCCCCCCCCRHSASWGVHKARADACTLDTRLGIRSTWRTLDTPSGRTRALAASSNTAKARHTTSRRQPPAAHGRALSCSRADAGANRARSLVAHNRGTSLDARCTRACATTCRRRVWGAASSARTRSPRRRSLLPLVVGSYLDANCVSSCVVWL